MVIPMLFFYVWPLYNPVTAETMYVKPVGHAGLSVSMLMLSRNWSSAMFGGVFIVACVYYVVKGRKTYAGLVTLVDRSEKGGLNR
jgi:choline transport protein